MTGSAAPPVTGLAAAGGIALDREQALAMVSLGPGSLGRVDLTRWICTWDSLWRRSLSVLRLPGTSAFPRGGGPG